MSNIAKPLRSSHCGFGKKYEKCCRLNGFLKNLISVLHDTYNKGKKNKDSTVIVKLLNLIFRCSGMSSGVTFDSNNLTIHNNAEEEDGK